MSIDKHTGAALAMIGVSVLNGYMWASTAMGGSTLIGLLLGAILVVKTYNNDFGGNLIGLYAILAVCGWFTAIARPDDGGLVGYQMLWIAGFLIAALVYNKTAVPIRGVAGATGPSPRALRKAEKDRIKANREAELAYAEQVHREQNAQKWATNPGHITGYEPEALAAVDIAAVRPAFMYGEPGAGLAGAGFDQAAVEKGQAGEVNFAKSLAKAGLLGGFATFWSVHMPDDQLGASDKFQTDIDCVVVTGKSVWLLDMKNYNQGDVTWKAERGHNEQGKDAMFLIATDNATGGQVGLKRKMSLNMKMATEVFQKRFRDSDVKFKVQPAVVLMPQSDGLGTIKNLKWSGDISVAGLPELLALLAKEPPYNANHRDAKVVMAILRPLIKDESGSAPKLGDVRLASTGGTWARKATPPSLQAGSAHVAQPATQSVPPAAPVVADPVVSAPAAQTCPDCGGVVQADWSICEHCGEVL